MAGGKTVGNDGVSNVEGTAVVEDAATSYSRIARDSAISDRGGAGGAVADTAAAAAKVCSIARDGGIGYGKGAEVIDTTTAALCCSIAGNGGIRDV